MYALRQHNKQLATGTLEECFKALMAYVILASTNPPVSRAVVCGTPIEPIGNTGQSTSFV